MSGLGVTGADSARHGTSAPGPLALWGGLECTVARIGDSVRDQIRETGHRGRSGDLAAVAALGIRTLRYPVLWESVEPETPGPRDWSWHDERLGQMRDLGLSPIAGLVHHGSGPFRTNLLDPAFPRLLAEHARRVAERYPWITDYTPVNEPLTTARFSGLYGHWYPHGTGYGPLLQALVNQVRGVQLSMQAIRAIVPDARLLQTEDLGKVFSTPELAYQADHENERRWLGFDLLCGRVGPGHRFHPILLDHGVAPRDLDALRAEPCVPDMIGVNHYLTSERWLDHRVSRFPGVAAGGNGRDAYVDIEAIRVPPGADDRGPAARLREVWSRYGLPIAVTEVHLGCTRDEQLRWLAQVWAAASTVRREGADIRAVTLWSLFGAVDWDSLLTRREGHYEPGAFDVRGPSPRRTALARAAASLARNGRFDHPILAGIPWWERPDRFHPALRPPSAAVPPRAGRTAMAPRLVVVGDGRLGRAVAEGCEARGLPVVLLGTDSLDPSDEAAVRTVLDDLRPWAVVNCCGLSAAAADAGWARCERDNVRTALILAQAAARLEAAHVVLSSDLVFDGRAARPSVESDPIRPVGAFGHSKARGERVVLGVHPEALVLRCGPLFGVGPPAMLGRAIRHARDATGAPRSRELLLSPSFVPDVVHAMLDLLVDRSSGVWHLANDGMIDGEELLLRMGPAPPVRPQRPTSGAASRRLLLASERSQIMPSLVSALERHARCAFRVAAE